MDIEYFIKKWENIDKKDINFSEEEWREISYYEYLSKEFIREFQDKVDWDWISKYQILSEEFMREFIDRVNWEYISRYQSLSEEFIKEFKDKVYWRYISYYQELSEEFIREFQNEVNWYNISYCQKLSGRFIDEFIIYIYYDKSFSNTYQERFCQSVNYNIYTINKRGLCYLGYQWNIDKKFMKLSNSTLLIIFSEVL